MENNTSSFSEVKHCLCVQGAYPEKLIDLWNDYDNDKGKLQGAYCSVEDKNVYSSMTFMSQIMLPLLCWVGRFCAFSIFML
jgi:hypothetical protein